jgi:diguanylate cyclase (GGDEF)-like protein
MEIKEFGLERKGGIFLLEGDRLRLICHLGHSEEFLKLHKDLKIGDCLCGLALQRQEVIISKNSEKDPRHTITYPDIRPHGHIIIPLRSPNKIIGVLYLYLPPDIELSKSKLLLLETIGSQIGTALENARLYEETKRLSLRDPLTGLSNRRLMEIVLERLMAEGRRYKTPFSALMIDIDSFKKYNDTYGHSAGDTLLLRISEIIKDSIRSSDVPIRYGGEEFLVLLPETDKNSASETAERIRREIALRTPVSVSIGVASYDDSVSSGKEVIDRADFALYRAKQSGKNRVEVAI